MGAREIGVELDRLGEQAARDLVGVPGALPAELLAAQIELVGVDVAGRRLAERVLLARQQLDLQHLDDAAGDLVLHREHVGEHPVVALGPQIAAGVRVDQLRRDPDPLAGLADAALQDVAHARAGGRPPATSSCTPLRAKAVWREATNSPETLVRSVIRSSAMPSLKKSWSGSLDLLAKGSTATDWPLGRPWRRRRRGPRHHHAIHPHRPLDVLEPPLADIFELAVEPAAHVIVGGARDGHAARLAQLLEAGGDVHPVAVDAALLGEDVGEVDPDPEVDPLGPRDVPLALGDATLDGDRTLDRIDHARELAQRIVAGEVDDPAVMLGDQRARAARGGTP